ncbi:hypothetical protein ACL6C3_23480 [Capilliphycus salinus ALCB114379]
MGNAPHYRTRPYMTSDDSGAGLDQLSVGKYKLIHQAAPTYNGT